MSLTSKTKVRCPLCRIMAAPILGNYFSVMRAMKLKESRYFHKCTFCNHKFNVTVVRKKHEVIYFSPPTLKPTES